ncbi:MAG: 23S rRNA (pseudouridine(1915)-N(3))-methyltransferase RlmH [Gemmatimonadota bacterium]
MRIEIIAVDRLRAPWAKAAVAEYLGRVARYAPAGRRDVKPARGDDARAVREEGERLLTAAAPGPRDRIVALAPTGEQLSSEEWAAIMSGWLLDGVARVVFLLGGAGGLSPAVLEAAHRTLSLGPQTLAHELAQVVLAEQLYRVFTIQRGEPYHK